MALSLTAPQISAVICTHNRADYLRRTLVSLCQQTLTQTDFEILVVDNGSVDGTQTLVRGEFAQVPNLRYLYEPILGLSQARNTGWQAAQGEYVAYLDDDAIASPLWLATLLESFQTVLPQPGIVCGQVEPIWEGERPTWLVEEFWPWFSVLNWSDQPEILDDRHFCGTNMAFSRAVLQALGGFSSDLGRKGRCLLSNEELLLQKQVKQLGYNTYYHPAAAVQHHIPADRQTQAWLLRRVLWQGISDAVLTRHLEPLSLPQRIYQIGCQTIGVLRSQRHRLRVWNQSASQRLRARQAAAYQVGYWIGLGVQTLPSDMRRNRPSLSLNPHALKLATQSSPWRSSA